MNRRTFLKAGLLPAMSIPTCAVALPVSRMVVTRANGPTVVDIGDGQIKSIALRCVDQAGAICIYDNRRGNLLDLYAFDAEGHQVSALLSLRVVFR